jgi:hypothetical protein
VFWRHAEEEKHAAKGHGGGAIVVVGYAAVDGVVGGRSCDGDAWAGGGLPVLVTLVGLGSSARDSFCKLGVDKRSLLGGGAANEEYL